MRKFLLLASVAVIGSLSANAQIFTDSFEAYSAPVGGATLVVTPNAFGPWNVTGGSIDVLNSYPSLAARTGSKNIDMDGFNAGGTISRTFTATAGVTYTLTYYYAGSQRNDVNTMTVTLGTSSTTHSNIPSGQGYTLGTVTWTAASSGAATVTFANGGADSLGLLLDDVSLTSNAVGTPTLSEWGMIGLTALLIMFGALKAQRVNA